MTDIPNFHDFRPRMSARETKAMQAAMTIRRLEYERMRSTGLLIGAVKAAGGELRVKRNGGAPILGALSITADEATDEYVLTLQADGPPEDPDSAPESGPRVVVAS